MTLENIKLDTSTYKSAKKYFKAALEQTLAAGRSARDFTEFALDKFGDTILPYIHEFSKDVSKGSVKIKGMADSARTVMLGHHVTPEQREEMIRVQAYLRAERRGFVGGSPEDDWFIACHQVDEQLASEAGLVEKGRHVLAEAETVFEKELDDVRRVVTKWLEKRHGKAAVKQTAGRKKTTKKSAASVKKSATKKATKKSAEKKAVTKKKAETQKKGTKKKATSKKKTAATVKATKKAASSKKGAGKKRATETVQPTARSPRAPTAGGA
jgi:NADH dehydrogenase/NADH:ubiquinone oxidoreductase subunit G